MSIKTHPTCLAGHSWCFKGTRLDAEILDKNIEATFRTMHNAGGVHMVSPAGHIWADSNHCNPSDLDDKRRIIWWTTGVEEGVFTDDDIPAADYSEVYKAMHGK